MNFAANFARRIMTRQHHRLHDTGTQPKPGCVNPRSRVQFRKSLIGLIRRWPSHSPSARLELQVGRLAECHWTAGALVLSMAEIHTAGPLTGSADGAISASGAGESGGDSEVPTSTAGQEPTEASRGDPADHIRNIWPPPRFVSAGSRRWSLTGASRAGRATGFYVPEAGLMLDAGQRSMANPDVIFVSHGHSDHAGALPFLLTELTSKPVVAVPSGHEGRYRAFLEAFSRMTTDGGGGTADALSPHRIDGVDAGTPPLEWSHRARAFRASFFRCVHRVSTVGIGVSEVTWKLKPQFQEDKDAMFAALAAARAAVEAEAEAAAVAAAADSGAATSGGSSEGAGGAAGARKGKSAAKARGGAASAATKAAVATAQRAAISDHTATPLFAFCGDTTHEVFAANPHLLETYPCVIVECTFFDAPERAAGGEGGGAAETGAADGVECCATPARATSRGVAGGRSDADVAAAATVSAAVAATSAAKPAPTTSAEAPPSTPAAAPAPALSRLQQRAAATRHTHWTFLRPIVEAHPHVTFVLTHFSPRFSTGQIADFFAAEALPNVVPWLN